MANDLSELAQALSSPNADEREAASNQLLRLGENAQGAAIALVRATADENEIVRENVVGTLEEIGSPDIGDLDALRELISSPTPDSAYWAITLIGRLGSAASLVVEDLASALANSKDLTVRQRAAWALGKIGPPATAAAPALREAAQSTDTRLARIAQKTLDSIK